MDSVTALRASGGPNGPRTIRPASLVSFKLRNPHSISELCSLGAGAPRPYRPLPAKGCALQAEAHQLNTSMKGKIGPSNLLHPHVRNPLKLSIFTDSCAEPFFLSAGLKQRLSG
jgi:hypothetical protein